MGDLDNRSTRPPWLVSGRRSLSCGAISWGCRGRNNASASVIVTVTSRMGDSPLCQGINVRPSLLLLNWKLILVSYCCWQGRFNLVAELSARIYNTGIVIDLSLKLLIIAFPDSGAISLQCFDTWLGDRKGIGLVKSWMLVCWWWRFDWIFNRLIAPVVTVHNLRHPYHQ